MKKILAFLITSILCINVFGQDIFEFINSSDGYSYIQINKNIDSFTFKSDWHSLGNAGKVGYVIYTTDMNDTERASYIKANANNPKFGKSIDNGIVNLGSLSSGDRVGFYEVRPNGGIYTQTSFKDWHNKTWLAFDKNGGHGKDEWMSITDINVVPSGSGNIPSGSSRGTQSGSPSGAPLPGVLAVLIVGVVGAGAYKTGKKK